VAGRPSTSSEVIRYLQYRIPVATGTVDDVDTVDAPPRPDGRRTRWAEHRRARREELVSAALRAISRHGAGVGMDELAATAGTSKTVLYRHFADKEDLYQAVAERVNRLLVRELNAAAARASGPRDALAGIISTYLHLVEKDPEVYRFVVSHPLVERVERDPVQRISGVIADETARTITAQLRVAGAASGATDALAHGLIAMIRTAADRWISSPAPQGADEMARDLTTLAWGGLSAVLPTPTAPAGPSAPAGTPEEDR